MRISEGASPWFTGNTVSQNALGLVALGAAPDANAAFANSIIFGNGVDVQGLPPARLRHCVVGTPGFAGVNGSLNADPLFLDAAGLDFRLRSGSPGVDAADDQLVPYSSVFDGRGLGALRRVDGDRNGTVRVDIGAFERGGLQVHQVGTGVGSTVHLEIDAGPGTVWFLGTGSMTDNPTAPVPGAFGYLFLDPMSLSLVAAAPSPPTGIVQLVVPIGDPLLIGARVALQAATLGAPPPMPSTAFTNAEVFEIR